MLICYTFTRVNLHILILAYKSLIISSTTSRGSLTHMITIRNSNNLWRHIWWERCHLSSISYVRI